MEISNSRTGAVPNQGWHLVRLAVAGLLLTASALKCWQLATAPVVGTSLLDSRWLLMATVEFELFFGIWLLANIWAKPTWAAALACFGLFTCVSVCKALAGYATCGCFGAVQIWPGWTAGMDLAIVLLLLRWRPSASSPLPPGEGKGEGDNAFVPHTRPTVAVLVTWLVIGMPVAVMMGRYTETMLSDNGEIIGYGKSVILRPETWIGRKFPLLSFIKDYPERLRSDERPLHERLVDGKWIVVLFRHDCQKCTDALPRYAELARRLSFEPRGPSVAMIEVPPYGKDRSLLLPLRKFCAIGRLTQDKDWFVDTPMVHNISDSIVTGRVSREADDD
jgi:hypothetical protein